LTFFLPSRRSEMLMSLFQREPGYLINDYFVRTPKCNKRCMMASA
jgi:hypothetical protein